MAENNQGVRGGFDAKTRSIFIIILTILILALVVGYFSLRKAVSVASKPGGAIPTAPAISSLPGVDTASKEYVRLQQQQNIQQAQQALRAGTTAIPTLTRTTYLGGVDLSLPSAQQGVVGCSVDDLQRAHRAGVAASELRCRGCDAIALKAAGYTAGELRNAGFTAKKLIAAGFTAQQLRDAGFGNDVLQKAGVAVSLPAVDAKTVAMLQKERANGVAASQLVKYGVAALKAAGYTARQLRDAGFTPEQLRAAGFTAKQLKGVGFTPEQLKSAGYTAGELRDAGFTAKQLKDAGFTPEQLRAAGFTAKQLKDAGFTPEQLKAAGFTDGDLIRAGFSPQQVMSKAAAEAPAISPEDAAKIARARALKASGYTASQLKASGYTAAQLRAAGFTAKQLKDAGFTAAQLKAAGYSDDALIGAGFTSQQIAAATRAIAAGMITPEDAAKIARARALKASGYTASQLKASGYTAAQLRAAGFTAKQLKDAGFTAAQLKAAGYSDDALIGAGFTSQQIAAATRAIAAGMITPEDAAKIARARALKASGYTASQLKTSGYTAAQLRAAGFTAKQLKDAGFTAAQLKAAGYSDDALIGAGFTPQQIVAATRAIAAGMITPEDAAKIARARALKAAGYTASQLKASGYTAAQLRAAGFTAKQLKDAGFTAAQLKAAGYSDDALIGAGFTPSSVLSDGSADVAGLSAGQTNGEKSVQATLAAIRNQQVKQMSKQEQEDETNKLKGDMMMQTGDLFSSWTLLPTQQFVVGKNPVTTSVGGVGVSGQSVSGGQAVATKDTVFKAGTVLFAVLDTGINSDEKSPILATIVSGKLKGTKAVGSFSLQGEKVVIQFHLLSVPYMDKSIAVSAYAIDPYTARTAIATSVDNHYMLRYGSLFASAFAEGLGQAVQTSGQSTVISGLTITQVYKTLNTREKALIAMGKVGQRFGQAMEKYADMPPTIKVSSGSGLGLLLMSDLIVPKKQ